MSNDELGLPEVGTTVHFMLSPLALGLGHAPDTCVPAIITEVEDGSNLGPNELPRDRMVQLAVVTVVGRQKFGGIGYSPLRAGDLSGTWHFKDEHENER